MASEDRKVIVRPATAADCPQIVEMIKMLASYEKMEELVRIDAETLIRDGFSENVPPRYHCLVSYESHNPDRLTGYLFYYYTYSTWEGRVIYMEDIFVNPSFRRKGLGKALITELAKIALEEKIPRIDFNILDWNELSINFHQSLGAVNKTQKHGWNSFRLNFDCLKKLALPTDG